MADTEKSKHPEHIRQKAAEFLRLRQQQQAPQPSQPVSIKPIRDDEDDAAPRLTRSDLRAQISIAARKPATQTRAGDSAPSALLPARPRRTSAPKKPVPARSVTPRPVATVATIAVHDEAALITPPVPAIPAPASTVPDKAFIERLDGAFEKQKAIIQTASGSVHDSSISTMLFDFSDHFRVLKILVYNERDLQRLLDEQEKGYTALIAEKSAFREVDNKPDRGFISFVQMLTNKL